MITVEIINNRHEQRPCSSCGHPYRQLTIFTFAPNGKIPLAIVCLCKKCKTENGVSIPGAFNKTPVTS